MRARALTLLLLCATLPAGLARADDRVVFREGGDVRGTVEVDGAAEVVVRVGTERRHYARDLVLRVEIDPALHAPKPAQEPAAAPEPGSAPAGDPARRVLKAPAGESARNDRPMIVSIPTGAASSAVEAAAKAGGDGESADAEAKDGAAAEPAPVDHVLLGVMDEGTNVARGAAIEAIAAGWPTTRPTFDAAITHPSAAVRLAATALLSQRRIPEPGPIVGELLSDPSPAVRRTAVRLVRTLSLGEFESRLVVKIGADPDRGVKIEALRSLEDVGTVASLAQLIFEMERERDENLRPRYQRILRRITGEDQGDDADKWREAAERAKRRVASGHASSDAPHAAR